MNEINIIIVFMASNISHHVSRATLRWKKKLEFTDFPNSEIRGGLRSPLTHKYDPLQLYAFLQACAFVEVKKGFKVQGSSFQKF